LQYHRLIVFGIPGSIKGRYFILLCLLLDFRQSLNFFLEFLPIPAGEFCKFFWVVVKPFSEFLGGGNLLNSFDVDFIHGNTFWQIYSQLLAAKGS
jgi:hypothetical protein